MQSNGALATREAHPNVERDLAVLISGPNVMEATQPVVITVAGGSCQPGSVVISPGTTLTIRNLDWFAHEFFVSAPTGDAPIEGFGPESTAPASQRSAQIPRAGSYLLRDRLNPLFRCWVTAGPGQGRLVSPTADGSFRTSNLAEGEYTLKVLFEGRTLTSTTVRVGPRETTVPPINVNAPPPAAEGAAPGAPAGAAPGAAAPDAAPATGRRRGRRR